MTTATEGGFTNDVERLTPEMAREMLATNIKNRSVSQTVVRRYRRDMEEDRWVFAGDPIRFSIEGHLLDGQHRLLALADCADGTEIDFVVQRGLDSVVQMAMDQGRKRSAGQQIELLGVPDPTIVAAAAKSHLIRSMGLLFRDNKLAQEQVSTAEIEEWVINNIDAITEIKDTYFNYVRRQKPPSVAYCAAIDFHAIDPEQSAEFFRQLSEGADGGHGHPINTLDRRLRDDQLNRIKVPTRDLLAFYIVAWNAWRDDRQLTKLQRPRGGSWTAETFPVAH